MPTSRPLPLLLALAACGPGETEDTSAPPIDPLDFAVDAPGPYHAGFRSWEMSYLPLAGPERSIVINLWYPTEDPSGDPVVYAGLAPDALAFGDAPPAPPQVNGTYPVHAHSHGHQGYGGTSADLMRWFASHGWVAVAPDHVGNLLLDNPDNEPLEFDSWRPQDVSAVLDALEDLPASDPLSGLADTTRVLVSGHSRGATTTWTLAGTLRTSWFGATGHRTVGAPVLSMTGSNDPVGQQEQWDAVDQIDFTWIELQGGCHQTFALGVCDTLDPAEGFWMVDTYALAFGRAHVLGDDGSTVQDLLDGSTVLDPRATLQRK